MPFSHEIFPEQRVIVSRYAGVFTFEELATAVTTLWATPGYLCEYRGIADLRDPSLKVAMSDFRALLNLLQQHKDRSTSRWAGVTRSPFVTACAMIYSHTQREPHTFTVFNTWAAACTFIGVTLPQRFNDDLV